MNGKARLYVDTSVKFEREAMQQVSPTLDFVQLTTAEHITAQHHSAAQHSTAQLVEALAQDRVRSSSIPPMCSTAECAAIPYSAFFGQVSRHICSQTGCKPWNAAQVESVQLASDSAQKQLELELANAKHNAAQAAAAHKSAAASWQGELDWQKSEVCHHTHALRSTWL